MARLGVPQTQRAHVLSPPRFGIVTVYDGSPKYECAMPLWCTSAKQLSRHDRQLRYNSEAIPTHPNPFLALTPSRQVDNSEVAIIGNGSSVDCPGVAQYWGNAAKTAEAASRSYLARHAIKGSWAYLMNAVLLKVIALSMVHYEVILFVDMDADVLPQP